MEIHLSPEKEARLSQIASSKGRHTDEFAQEVLERYLECDARFIEAVSAGLAAADREEFVEPEEVWAHVEEILRS
jgi:predicted transcriptional regulator